MYHAALGGVVSVFVAPPALYFLPASFKASWLAGGDYGHIDYSCEEVPFIRDIDRDLSQNVIVGIRSGESSCTFLHCHPFFIILSLQVANSVCKLVSPGGCPPILLNFSLKCDVPLQVEGTIYCEGEQLKLVKEQSLASGEWREWVWLRSHLKETGVDRTSSSTCGKQLRGVSQSHNR